MMDPNVETQRAQIHVAEMQRPVAPRRALRIINSRSSNPFFNLAMEEFFILSREWGGVPAVLFFYENSDSVVLGKSQQYQREVYSHKALPPVIRRGSGGGSVVHFKGNLNYGLLLDLSVYPELFPIGTSYRAILGAVSRGLFGLSDGLSPPSLTSHHGLRGGPSGISDIATTARGASKKISGNAQLRKRGRLLHHGTLLYDLKGSNRISYWLRPPGVEPEYRAGRTHRDFMARVLPLRSRSVVASRVSAALGELLGLPLLAQNLSAIEARGIRRSMGEFVTQRKLSS